MGNAVVKPKSKKQILFAILFCIREILPEKKDLIAEIEREKRRMYG